MTLGVHAESWIATFWMWLCVWNPFHSTAYQPQIRSLLCFCLSFHFLQILQISIESLRISVIFLTFCRSSISVPLLGESTSQKVPSAPPISPGPASPSYYSQHVLSKMWATKSGSVCETCGIAHVGTSDDKVTSKIRTFVLACWLLEGF